jgi:hypothetical protein
MCGIFFSFLILFFPYSHKIHFKMGKEKKISKKNGEGKRNHRLLSQDIQFYRLFGLQQCEKYGKKETTEFLKQKKAQLCRWWTK